MRVKFLPLIAVMAAAALALTMVSGGRAAVGDIFSSDHDLGSPGNPTCAQCHIPHQAQGDYLWARVPGASYMPGLSEDDAGPDTCEDTIDNGADGAVDAADSDCNLGSLSLCFSCHDGSITPRGMYIPAPGTINHPMGPYTHLYDLHDPSRGCLACHDAHDADFKFTWDVMNTGKPDNPDNANVCLSCHSMTHPTRGLAPSHPFDVEDPGDLSWRTAEDPDVPTSVVEMTASLPVDQTFDPSAADPEGTRLWDSATRQTPVGAGQPGKLACMSCHSPHGAVNEYLNTIEEADPASSHAPLCENCHQ